MQQRIIATIGAILISSLAMAQPRQQPVTVVVAPDRADWTYAVGEEASFSITVMKYGNLLDGVELEYEVKPEKMDQAIKTGTLRTTAGAARVEGLTMSTPGFLRCWATVKMDGLEYRGMATAGFSPEEIRPTVPYPEDFVAFWEKAKAEAAEIPMDAKLTLLPERCTEKLNVYHVGLQNYRLESRIYGILCVPKKPGKYPAVLRVPGAGVRPYYGDLQMAEKGLITFQIGIHGIPVNLAPQVYADLRLGALADYPRNKLDDRDAYYYKRVYLGCVRSVDFIFSLPEFDGENIGVTGGSQGGALSIVTAGLDPRIKWLAAYYPALSDVTGYLEGRAGGWPHLFRSETESVNELRIATVPYYDVVNFARQLSAAGIYSWGYNDWVCPPTSMYSAYNVITASKELVVAQDTGHWTYPEQREKVDNWLVSKLKGND